MSKKVKKAKAKTKKKPVKKATTFEDQDSPPGDPEPPPAKGN
jgi:hypothetical protein